MRLIDAEHFDVIAYSKDVDGYEDTFDDGVRWIAEQIDKADTVDAIQMKDWENLKQIIIDGDLIDRDALKKQCWHDDGFDLWVSHTEIDQQPEVVAAERKDDEQIH